MTIPRRALTWTALALTLLAGGLLITRQSSFGTVEEVPEREKTMLSETYTVDQKYRSMMGPWSSQPVLLHPSEPPELVWITGYEAVMVGPDGETQKPQDFMCHSNLDIDVAEHLREVGATPAFSPRLFTLSQGQFEIDFPEGFGIPVMSDRALDLTTQVLNLNHEGAPVEVRHKVTIDYVLDRDLDRPMKALFPVGAYGLALLEGDDGYFGVSKPDEEHHGPGCMIGDNASDHTYDDLRGRKFTGHWVVPPGRQVNHTLVTHLMQVPYDTRIHYIAVHLHPFAESLELRDLTTGETLFKSKAHNLGGGRIGLAEVEAFSSAEGIPVYRDHEYELVSVYDNTSGESQDSMAVMYIYLRDHEVEKRLDHLRG